MPGALPDPFSDVDLRALWIVSLIGFILYLGTLIIVAITLFSSQAGKMQRIFAANNFIFCALRMLHCLSHVARFFNFYDAHLRHIDWILPFPFLLTVFTALLSGWRQLTRPLKSVAVPRSQRFTLFVYFCIAAAFAITIADCVVHFFILDEYVPYLVGATNIGLSILFIAVSLILIWLATSISSRFRQTFSQLSPQLSQVLRQGLRRTWAVSALSVACFVVLSVVMVSDSAYYIRDGKFRWYIGYCEYTRMYEFTSVWWNEILYLLAGWGPAAVISFTYKVDPARSRSVARDTAPLLGE